MTGEQLKLLSRMKKLIIQGNKKFAIRKDRDYLAELLEIRITENLAWQEILPYLHIIMCQIINHST